MKQKHLVALVKDILPGKGYKIKIGKEIIALFNYKGKFFAIQNRCPHQNADLADGYIKEGRVHCALHNWAFDLSTGSISFNPDQKIKTFSVLIENDSIYIETELKDTQ